MHDETQHTRRLKKREVDRKAQRSARERTKRRIAHPESTVENLRQKDSKAQIASLMDQLDQVTKERDKLLQVLDSLGSTIRRHLGDLTTSEPASDTISEPSTHASTRGPTSPTMGDRIIPITTTTTSVSLETTGSVILQIPMDPSPNDPFPYNGWNYTASNEPYSMAIAFHN
ncbi:hypothetical protein BFJ63_vAg17497 [Fusarium oxysporum f. sp. narcissi]|uniref:BZIP domain-containing protein n=1 Tax=Fusarium oxysporum f. sp. narcissi TaxID=451672 RepID=A0A4Q2V6R6_FUSOX|nr:hypothetical protein BFJ63_vAg17497 [Fusarium oxysporum f. sp. narcissi]